MTPWIIAQCLYFMIGGGLAPALIGRLFARDHAWGPSLDPAPAFVIVIGVLALWPALLLLIVENGSE